MVKQDSFIGFINLKDIKQYANSSAKLIDLCGFTPNNALYSPSTGNTKILTRLKMSGFCIRVVVTTVFVVMSGHQCYVQTVQHGPLTYLGSSVHHKKKTNKKTITIIFLVMRFSTGTRGYGTHIQTSDSPHQTVSTNMCLMSMTLCLGH